MEPRWPYGEAELRSEGRYRLDGARYFERLLPSIVLLGDWAQAVPVPRLGRDGGLLVCHMVLGGDARRTGRREVVAL